MTNDAKLTMGPVLFNWSAETWRDFYFRIADEAEVDSVCVGEVVCSKRQPFFAPHLAAVIERLERGGKEVAISVLSLIMAPRELKDLRAVAEDSTLYVEANDMAAVSLLKDRTFAVGPMINVYNEGTLQALERMGANRISLPGELPRESLTVLAEAATTAELEVQVFGRLPLAISARCYHARHRGLSKDSCQYACAVDPDGMSLETLDGEEFLAVNGTQTLSHSAVNLIAELVDLQALGINRFRLSPHQIDMVAVAQTFRDVLRGSKDWQEADEDLQDLAPELPFANGFFHGVAGKDLVAPMVE